MASTTAISAQTTAATSGDITVASGAAIQIWVSPLLGDDENGDEVSRTPPSSNADLRDINLLSGQSPRRFA